MNPRERAAAVLSSLSGATIDAARWRAEIEAAIQEAVQEERAACAQAMCVYCSMGVPVRDDVRVAAGHDEVQLGPVHLPDDSPRHGFISGFAPCQAAAIRRRGAKEE